MLSAALALAAPASAQPLQRSDDPEGAVVEALVVRARAPGPAWWKVSDGDSVVWVLGLPAALPKGAAWNDLLARERLGRARELILPAQVKVGPLKALGFFLKHRKDLRSKAPLEPGLPPELARRFAAARTGLGQAEKRYRDWKPAIAGVILNSDFRRKARLDPGEPLGHLRALARKAGRRERPAANYASGPVLDALLTMSPEAHLQCLEDAVEEVEAGASRANAAAQGWAEGNPARALTAERGYDRCFAVLPAISQLLRAGQADMASAIVSALERPGETVAVIDLRGLLAENGVLEQLKRRGLKVETPAADAGL